MDYKIETLTVKVKIEDVMMPEISGLYFGAISEDKMVFDYTRYFDENGIEPIDHKVFMRSAKRFIEFLAEQYSKKTSELFYVNADGHVLVDSVLVNLFLAFVSPELCLYMNNLLNEVLTNGVAYSNGFAYAIAAERLPSDALSDIIKERETDETESR